MATAAFRKRKAGTKGMSKERLKAIREYLGLDFEGLAKHLGVVPRTIGKWEYGERHVPNPVAILMGILRKQKESPQTPIGSIVVKM